MKVNEKQKSVKRLKVELTYDLKKQICKIYQENLKLNKHYTQANLIEDVIPITGIKIARSTLSDILKKMDKIEG